MSLLYLALFPLIGALIGWLTNRLAIQMLFHPRESRKFLGWEWQGLIPRRRSEIAEKTADIVAEELIGGNHLRQKIEEIDIVPLMHEMINSLVQERLAPKLKAIPLLGGFINEQRVAQIYEVAMEEAHREAPRLKSRIATSAEAHLDVRKMVKERIEELDLDQLERITWKLAGREFRQIEWLGGILGALVGLAQCVIVVLTR